MAIFQITKITFRKITLLSRLCRHLRQEQQELAQQANSKQFQQYLRAAGTKLPFFYAMFLLNVYLSMVLELNQVTGYNLDLQS